MDPTDLARNVEQALVRCVHLADADAEVASPIETRCGKTVHISWVFFGEKTFRNFTRMFERVESCPACVEIAGG